MTCQCFIRRLLLPTVACLVLGPTIALAATENGVLTVGRSALIIPPVINVCLSGYSGGGFLGSYSPTGLSGGETIANIVDSGSCSGSEFSTVGIAGFSANPGQDWLTSITCNGVTKSGSSATYSFSNQFATWVWTTSNFGLQSIAQGTNVTCTFVHN
jgi:hypothetical protein